jgi:hypothetical protein
LSNTTIWTAFFRKAEIGRFGLPFLYVTARRNLTGIAVGILVLRSAAAAAPLAGSEHPQLASGVAVAVTPADYVRIRSGRFELRGQPFVLRGTNYSGSWRFPYTFPRADGTEQATVWSLFRGWDARKAALDFRFPQIAVAGNDFARPHSLAG